MSEQYKNICRAVDGKTYSEWERYGFDFLSRHKESCRKKENGYYLTRTHEVRTGGITSEVCDNCGYTIKASYHFPEDMVQ